MVIVCESSRVPHSFGSAMLSAVAIFKFERRTKIAAQSQDTIRPITEADKGPTK